MPPQPWLMTIVGACRSSGSFGAKTSAAMRVPSLRMSAVRKVTSSGTLKPGRFLGETPEDAIESASEIVANTWAGCMGLSLDREL